MRDLGLGIVGIDLSGNPIVGEWYCCQSITFSLSFYLVQSICQQLLVVYKSQILCSLIILLLQMVV